MFKKIIVYSSSALLTLSIVSVGLVVLFLYSSLPIIDGNLILEKLNSPVTVSSDRHGISKITATSTTDAMRILGFISARDRLFQMELMRRKNAGRLAEIFGSAAVHSDIKARTYGFDQIAKAVVKNLPEKHTRWLTAYAEGVNSYISTTKTLPFEFSILDFQPELWQVKDSILIILGMHDMLTSWVEKEERMLTVMEQTLPAKVFAFLTPDTDSYTDRLQQHKPTHRPAQAIPIAELQSVLDHSRYQATINSLLSHNSVDPAPPHIPGSNAWAVSGMHTADGRAILANDMHLRISAPNIWYRSEIDDGSTHIAGVVLPGTPLFIAGSNEHIAWGATNLSGDFLDLVSLEINPENQDEYKIGKRWQRFSKTTKIILIKDQEPRKLVVKHTIWGPVATQPLLGKPVAIRWTALDSKVVNTGMLDLLHESNLQSAINTVNRTGGPQLNILLADSQGNIGWTLMGKIPRRIGFDGSVSRSWTQTGIGWDGYIESNALPKQINPAQGILVSANDRRFGSKDPYIIGRQFANGYRAFHITEKLKQIEQADEWSMFNLQLDTESQFYAFYHHLALDLINVEKIKHHPELQSIRQYLRSWDGRADSDSLGFALVVQFRKQLIKSIFTPIVNVCKTADKDFSYRWSYVDTPLQALLTRQLPQLLPDTQNFQRWDEFLLAQLLTSVKQLKANHPDTELAELNWGKVNQSQFQHPFSNSIPFIGLLVDLPKNEMPGCNSCIRASGISYGASERLVVSPGHFDEAILHMPGGQSAHPFSTYFNNQHNYWLKGIPMNLLTEQTQHSLLFSNQAHTAK